MKSEKVTSRVYYLFILVYSTNSLPHVFPAFVAFRFHIPFCISSNFFNFLLACKNLFGKLGCPCHACFFDRIRRPKILAGCHYNEEKISRDLTQKKRGYWPVQINDNRIATGQILKKPVEVVKGRILAG